jgi:hypothetical protein
MKSHRRPARPAGKEEESAMLLRPARPSVRSSAGAIPRRAFLGAAIASAGALWVAPRAALAQDEEWKKLLGSFKFAGGAAEEARRLKAIDDVVDKMSPIVRGIARGKLREATVIAPRISLATVGKNFTMADDEHRYTAPTDGSVVKVTVFNGDEMDLSYDLKDDEIVQLFSDGSKGSVHSFSRSGDKLVVRHAVFASQLPERIVYNTTYAWA